jgi:hypothetical protein
MRKFNDFEKGILTKIVNNETFVANFIDRYLSGVRIQIYRNEKKVFYLFDVNDIKNLQPDESNKVIERLNEINGLVIAIVNLLSFLEKKEWITVIKTVTVEDNIITFGQGIGYKNGKPNEDVIGSEMTDPNIIDGLIKYCFNSILPTTELTFFVTSGFMTEEEINYQNEEARQKQNNEISLKNVEATRENIRLARSSKNAAWAASIIALLTLLATLIFNIFGSSSINNTQLDNLLKKLDKISFSIDSIRVNKDTINAHIFSIEDSVNVKNNLMLDKKKERKK